MAEAQERDVCRAAFELVGVVIGMELVLFSDAFPAPSLAAVVGASGMLAALAFSLLRRRADFLPRSRRSWLPSWALAGAATLLCAVAVLGLARGMGWWTGESLHFDAEAFASWGDLRWWLHKLAAVSAQQLLLQLWVLPLCIEIVKTPLLALAMAGLVFGGVHLPNPTLSLLTAVAAPIWCAIFVRTGRLAPLLASHLLLAILVRAACGDAIFNMRVGASVLPLLPRTIAAGDGSVARVAPRSVEGFLDECRAAEGVVVCRGWSADVDRRRPSDEIMVLGPETWRRGPTRRFARPDVAEHFGMPGLLECGFEVELPTSWFAGPARPRFFGVAGEQIAELEYHELPPAD